MSIFGNRDMSKKLCDGLESAQKEIKDLRKKLSDRDTDVARLWAAVRTLQAAVERPKLQALLDEYVKFGGPADEYSLCTDEPMITNGLRGFSRQSYSVMDFRRIIDSQKARWAEQHQCKTGKRK